MLRAQRDRHQNSVTTTTEDSSSSDSSTSSTDVDDEDDGDEEDNITNADVNMVKNDITSEKPIATAIETNNGDKYIEDKVQFEAIKEPNKINGNNLLNIPKEVDTSLPDNLPPSLQDRINDLKKIGKMSKSKSEFIATETLTLVDEYV